MHGELVLLGHGLADAGEHLARALRAVRAGAAGELMDDDDALLALDAALARLERRHPRQAKAVELRYFGGLTLEEVGEALGVSAPTAMRDLRFAQAWLAAALGDEA